MTMEKVIGVLKRRKTCIGCVANLTCKECDEALDMAIKALEQQPCTDAISRQEAIDAMATWDWQELYLPIHFKQLLEDLSTVSVAEKVGTDHWEKLWYELYNWLNDTRLNIAPDETVKDDVERHERLAQADMLDEVMECMLDLESRREEGETDG